MKEDFNLTFIFRNRSRYRRSVEIKRYEELTENGKYRVSSSLLPRINQESSDTNQKYLTEKGISGLF